MKTVFLLLTFSVYVKSRQRLVRQAAGEVIPIISYENQHYGDGFYVYSYTTGNGISVEEEGELKPGGENGMGLQTARGSYSYTAPNGEVISVTWYADETGFHPQGEHIPGRQDLRGPQGPSLDMLPPDKGYNYEPPSVPFAPVYPIK